MRVLHLCMQHYGGAGTAAYRLHAGLVAQGVDSRMCVLNRQGDDAAISVATREGEPVHAVTGADGVVTHISQAWVDAGRRWQALLADYPERPGNLEIFTDTASTLDVDDIPGIHEADVVHLHWVAGMIDFSSPLGALSARPVVWTLHDMNPFTGGCHYSAGCERWAEGCGMCPALGSTRRDDISHAAWRTRHAAYGALRPEVVTPSRWLGGLASRSPLFSGRRVRVIPNGLDTEGFRPWPTPAIREGLGVPQDAFVVLFGAASVANHRKGFRQLVRALEELQSLGRVPNAVLGVFGQWGGAAPRLPFPVMEFGYVHDERTLAALYSMADMVLIPSLEDNLPSVVLEALACGTPVGAFDVGGMPDMVDHRATGWLARPYDARDLASGIVWANAMKERDPALGVRCRTTVLERFSLTGQVQAYRDLYTRLTQATAPRAYSV